MLAGVPESQSSTHDICQPSQNTEMPQSPPEPSQSITRVPTAPRRIRRPNPKTGKWPRIKVCGYTWTRKDIDAWAAKKNILQDRTPRNREYRALFMILDMLPDDIQWQIVTPHEGEDTVVSCIAIGSDRSVRDLKNAYNPARARLVRNAMDKVLGPPKWYYLREDFHRDD
ncbi:hypothetical protein CPB84DRAFT_1801853 [Gymnopilus junonius]|uniref:Uncharacterized protein n=1 Tax=Gymnopilus junonius TaxID=109634 RepID=A0A9P5N757_GYMJU|nr:hypothetical protein CPB84DRAFT_1801853 [Gymnopilus junonius]